MSAHEIGSVGLTERAGGGSRSSTVAYQLSVSQAWSNGHCTNIRLGICLPIVPGSRHLVRRSQCLDPLP